MVGPLVYGYRDGKAVPLATDSKGNLKLSTAELEAIQQGTPIPPFEQFTSDQLENGVTLAPPPGATRAVVQAIGGSGVRWRQDGLEPTAQMGMRIEAGDEREFIGNLDWLIFVGEGDNSSLAVSYYG